MLIIFEDRLLIVIRFVIAPFKLAFEMVSLVFVSLEEFCFVLSPPGFVFLRATEWGKRN